MCVYYVTDFSIKASMSDNLCKSLAHTYACMYVRADFYSALTSVYDILYNY